MNDTSDSSEDKTPFFEQNFTFTPKSVPNTEDKSYLSSLLAKRNEQVQNQSIQIEQLLTSAKEYLNIIDELDKAVPIEEQKIAELTEQNNALQRKFMQLQLEINNHQENEENNHSTIEDTEQNLADSLSKHNEMRFDFEQSRQKQMVLNDHIMTLQNSCDLLNNDIDDLRMKNTNQNNLKHQFENMKDELTSLNEKIDQMKIKHEELAEHLSKTNLQIQKYQDKNLKTELELYDELKIKESNRSKKKTMNFNIDIEPEIIQQNLNKAKQRLKEKEIILQNEKEIYVYNEVKVKKLRKKLYEQKRVIRHLKKHINLLETQIQQEQYLMFVIRQQHEQLMINTNQFSAQIEQSVKKIEKIKKEKKSLKRQLEHAKNCFNNIQDKITSINSFENNDLKEKDIPITNPALDPVEPAVIDTIRDDEGYQDHTIRTIDIMRKQSNNLKKNQKQMEDMKFDQKFLNKRIKNCHNGVVNKQYRRDSLFPTSKYSPK